MGRFIFIGFGLLVVFLSLSGSGADEGCSSDWSSYNGYCYKVFKLRKTWANAERYCREQEEGGHLASILNMEESAFVARLAYYNADLLRTGVWIGLSDPERNGNWQWSDGSPVSYISWNRREPNNFWNLGKESCVELWLFSKYLGWNDQRCWFLRYFICKFQPQVEGSNE